MLKLAIPLAVGQQGQGLVLGEGECHTPPVVRTVNSRVGRERQRFDGATRLITGCVPLIGERVMMVSSGGKKIGWIVPKGGWEDDETVQAGAIREAYEESGVIGELGMALPPVSFVSKSGGLCRLQLFILHVKEVVSEWPESHRERKLVSLDQAILDCKRAEMREALLFMKERRLHKGGGGVANSNNKQRSSSSNQKDEGGQQLLQEMQQQEEEDNMAILES